MQLISVPSMHVTEAEAAPLRVKPVLSMAAQTQSFHDCVNVVSVHSFLD